MGIELKQKQGNVTLTAPRGGTGGTVDLSNYYTKAQTDEKIQEVVNAIPEVDLTGYATEEYVNNAIANIDIPEVDFTGYATEDFVRDSISAIEFPEPDLSPYALKTEIPSIEGLASETYVDNRVAEDTESTLSYVNTNFATKEEIPDISNLATKDEILTEEEVIELIRGNSNYESGVGVKY